MYKIAFFLPPLRHCQIVPLTMTRQDTFPILTRYERTALLGKRAAQLQNGAKATISTTGITNIYKIAEEELKRGTMPIRIIRNHLQIGMVPVHTIDPNQLFHEDGSCKIPHTAE